jgi:hypothetical protein
MIIHVTKNILNVERNVAIPLALIIAALTSKIARELIPVIFCIYNALIINY